MTITDEIEDLIRRKPGLTERDSGPAPVWWTVAGLGRGGKFDGILCSCLRSLFCPAQQPSHCFVPARTAVPPARGAAVKDWGRPEGLSLKRLPSFIAVAPCLLVAASQNVIQAQPTRS